MIVVPVLISELSHSSGARKGAAFFAVPTENA